MDRINEILNRTLNDIHKKEKKKRAAYNEIDQNLEQADKNMDSVRKTQSEIEDLLDLL